MEPEKWSMKKLHFGLEKESMLLVAIVQYILDMRG